MTLTGIIDSLKTMLNPSKIMNSLEGAASFSDPSERDSEGNLEINPYFNSGNGAANSSAVRISQNKDEPLIKLTDVWKIYQMGEVEFAALKGINLEIYEGEFLIILGPSGSGKSTMMNLLGCLDIPSKGTVCLNSKDISELDESELAIIRGQMIGFIFQSFNLLSTLSTEENVLLPMEFQEEDRQMARQKASYLLDIVGLSEKKQNRPSQLSGGQRQRVAIARSLAVNPPIILADEPTGNLDSKTGDYIMDFLDGLHEREGKTIIIVTHDIELVRYATRVVYIRDGEIEKIERRTKNEPGMKHEPSIENEPGMKHEPSIENESSPKNEPSIENESSPKNEPSIENESSPKNEPSIENESSIKNKPSTKNEPDLD